MSAAHEELFSYVLHLELDIEDRQNKLSPLRLKPYRSVRMMDTEPHVVLALGGAELTIDWADSAFRIAADRAELQVFSGIEELLVDQLGFTRDDSDLTRLVPRENAIDVVFQLAQLLTEIEME